MSNRQKQQRASLARTKAESQWRKNNPKPQNKGNAAKYNEAMRVWRAKWKAFKNQKPPTKQDIADARNEEATANLRKTDLTKDPGPGVGKDGKPRTATLEEDQARNTPKPPPNKEGEESKNEKLKIDKSGGPTIDKEGKSTPEYDKRLQENKAKSDAKDRATYKEKWLKDTANSPAAKAGFSPEQRWEQHVKHQNWKKEKGRNHEKLAIGSKKDKKK